MSSNFTLLFPVLDRALLISPLKVIDNLLLCGSLLSQLLDGALLHPVLQWASSAFNGHPVPMGIQCLTKADM